MILLKYSYLVIFNKHVVPKSTFNRYIHNIYPLFQCSNITYLQKIFTAGIISQGKVREVVGLTLHMKKAGLRTYLHENKESLIVLSAKIEGDHGLTLDRQLSKSQVWWLKNQRKLSLRYFRTLINYVNKKEHEHEIQTRKSLTGLVKVSNFINNCATDIDPRID